ncbi:MAG: hypothetical protein HN356_00560 [Calditrichaeota bacterium]|jgi:hypothetical protein|nr:hypothetical protein [Calditrichota bacterium]MBT7788284.1 hypothetical protein [Calditrichota bacterium]
MTIFSYTRNYFFRAMVIFVFLGLFCNYPLNARIFNLDPFVYYYDGVDSNKVINNLDQKLKSKLPELESQLGVKFSGKAGIHLTQTREEFYRVTRGRAPGWAGGIAYSSQRKVVVKSPLFFGQGVSLEALTTHEITHLILHEATSGNYLPRWLEEGLCMILAGESRSGSLARLGRAAAASRLMGLPRVDDVLRFSAPQADLAYSESRSAAVYLIDRFGWQAVRDILKYVRADRDFEEAFSIATGVEYEPWQVEWIEYALNRYRWVFLLDIDNLVWFSIVLLGTVVMIMAYVRQRRQMRALLEEMEDDDEYFPEYDTDEFRKKSEEHPEEDEWETPYKW